MTFLFLVGWALLISFGRTGIGLSSITMTLYALNNISIPTFLVVAFIISFIVFVVFGIIYLMKQYKYIFIPFVGLDSPSTKGFKLVAKSRELMKGHRWELFVMHLSFFWWILLIGVTLGLASFYVMPYIYLTLAGYYDVINNTQKNKATEVTDKQGPIKAIVLQPNSTY